MALVAGDDELGFGGERAGEDMIIVGVAAHRGGECVRGDDLGQAFIVLNELGGGKPRGAHPLGELLSRAITSASSAKSVRLVQRAMRRSRARSSRRRGGPCHKSPERTVLVSATIRIAAVPGGAYGIDLGLYVL